MASEPEIEVEVINFDLSRKDKEKFELMNKEELIPISSLSQTTNLASVGVETSYGGMQPIINKGQPYSNDNNIEFTTTINGSNTVSVRFYEGGRSLTKYNNYITSIGIQMAEQISEVFIIKIQMLQLSIYETKVILTASINGNTSIIKKVLLIRRTEDYVQYWYCNKTNHDMLHTNFMNEQKESQYIKAKLDFIEYIEGNINTFTTYGQSISAKIGNDAFNKIMILLNNSREVPTREGVTKEEYERLLTEVESIINTIMEPFLHKDSETNTESGTGARAEEQEPQTHLQQVNKKVITLENVPDEHTNHFS